MRMASGGVAAALSSALLILPGACAPPSSASGSTIHPGAQAHVHSRDHRHPRPPPARNTSPSRKTSAHRNLRPTAPTHPSRTRHVASGPECPGSNVLSGVYHPYRLNVLDPCRTASGTIAEVIPEEDGDLHLYLDLDPGSSKLAAAGMLTVELMPRDGGHLPAPSVGDHVSFVGAWMWDGDHSWRELHPVWSETLAGKTYRSGPRFGGSPAFATYATAWRLCRTSSGALCAGYGAAPQVAHSNSSTSHGAGRCNPNYGPVCIPSSSSDLDCPDVPFHDFKVTGVDVYGFDGDGDRVACES